MMGSRLLENTNNLHGAIKTFEYYFPEEFEKTDIKKCGHCNSTGLTDKSQMRFCENCGGTGFVGYEKIQNSYTCRSCNGGGCQLCKYVGMIDWVKHATGEDVKEGKITL